MQLCQRLTISAFGTCCVFFQLGALEGSVLNSQFSVWVWLKMKQEGQTAGFGPCFHLPGQPILGTYVCPTPMSPNRSRRFLVGFPPGKLARDRTSRARSPQLSRRCERAMDFSDGEKGAVDFP